MLRFPAEVFYRDEPKFDTTFKLGKFRLFALSIHNITCDTMLKNFEVLFCFRVSSNSYVFFSSQITIIFIIFYIIREF